MPCYLTIPAYTAELLLMLVFSYIFFLIIQLALFNLVIIGIIFVSLKKIFQLAETLRWRLMFNYKTKDFLAFIEAENTNVYKDLHIEIVPEREG
jgi:hypothetical protein